MTSVKTSIKNHSRLLCRGILQMNKCLAPNTAPKSNRTLHEFRRRPGLDPRPAPALALPGPPIPPGNEPFTRTSHKALRPGRRVQTPVREQLGLRGCEGHVPRGTPTGRLSRTGFCCPLRWSPGRDGKLCPSIHAPEKSEPAPTRPPATAHSASASKSLVISFQTTT